MKRSGVIIAIAVLFGVLILGGCAPTQQATPVGEEIGITKETIIEKVGNTVYITGKVTEIRFSAAYFEPDILTFADGVIIANAYKARQFVWQLGKTHKITIDSRNNSIVTVDILD